MPRTPATSTLRPLLGADLREYRRMRKLETWEIARQFEVPEDEILAAEEREAWPLSDDLADRLRRAQNRRRK